MLIDTLTMMPSAGEASIPAAEDKEGNLVEVACEADAPLSAYVFKTVADPFVGKLSFVKGGIRGNHAGSQLVNTVSGQSEKPGKLLLVRGKKQEDVKNISAGVLAH